MVLYFIQQLYIGECCMRRDERSELNSLRRVQRFGAMPWATLSPQPPGFADQLAVVDESIATVEILAAEQQSGSISRSIRKRRALRKKLRRTLLSPMRKISRIIEKTHP